MRDKFELNSQEERFIQSWHDRLENNIHIRLVLTEDKRSRDFKAYAEYFASNAPGVLIKKENSNTTDMPAFAVCGNIFFHALPSGKELEPFLNTLTQSLAHSASMPAGVRDLDKVALPAQIDLYIALACGFCPTAVNSLVPLALNCPHMRLSIIDAFLFDERSKAHSIRSVPTVLFDDAYRWTGRFDSQEIVDRMVDRDPAGVSASSLENLIKEGEAAQVAEMMLSFGKVFPAFLELLVHEKWPVRLGAMVAMETVIEKDIGIAAQAIEFLKLTSQTVKDPIKGDIYYILGEIGDESLIPTLDQVLAGNPGTEIKEALEEAIDRIRERHPPLK